MSTLLTLLIVPAGFSLADGLERRLGPWLRDRILTYRPGDDERDSAESSDEDDEIHAHTGGDGYELEVPAGEATTGTFTPTSPSSFEIESHHLEKVIVVLNVS